MEDRHRTNVLVTSCLKTPVNPRTRAPSASYERETLVALAAPGHVDNREHEDEDKMADDEEKIKSVTSLRTSSRLYLSVKLRLEDEDSGSDFCDDARYVGDHAHHAGGHAHQVGGHAPALDVSGVFFSNEEYYSKLEELKKAHLLTMAELENMYRQKLHLKLLEPVEAGLRWAEPAQRSNTASSRRLRKSLSALELRRRSSSDSEGVACEGGACEGVACEGGACEGVAKAQFFSPKEHIRNMWRNFSSSPNARPSSASSLHGLTDGDRKRRSLKDGEQQTRKRRVTVPTPFRMTLREAERRRRGVKTRSEVELENAALRRQLDELAEGRGTFRASPVPAHAQEERRRRRSRSVGTVSKPFSFLERERLKKEQRQRRPPEDEDEDALKPFKAKPVPRSVYAAASGEEQQKEAELYRSIKIQMRARELLHSAALPRSMLTPPRPRRQRQRSEGEGDESAVFSHRPRINTRVPDFDATYRRFRERLQKTKEVKASTACEPFHLRTAHVASHRQRVLDDIKKERGGPRTPPPRWPLVRAAAAATPTSSLCSSLSGSLELLPLRVTDATKKRHDAVRKVLQRRKEAEQEAELWRERQQQKEKTLQREVLKRAQANDPHIALSQTQPHKLREFRKQDVQRHREHQQEMKEMEQRVKQRPLLLEQVTQINAKQAAERRYAGALRGCDVTEEFVSGKAAEARSSSHSSDRDDNDAEASGYQSVHFRKVFLDDEDVDVDGGGDNEERGGRRLQADERSDDGSYRYSDDHESYSDESERDADTGQQEAAE